MNHFKLKLSYKGTHYFGWQIQPDQITVQGELHKALKKLCVDKEFKTMGSGRTDAGVHALCQICKISTTMDIESYSMLKALNTFLPKDIKVLDAKTCDESFMPTVDAVSKTYFYLFSNQEVLNPIASEFITNNSFSLDIEKMKRACGCFIGEFDFHNFQTTGTEVKSTVRKVTKCELKIVEQHDFLPSHYKLVLEGNGFLKQMVRLVVGAIWEVGRGKVSIDDIKNALSTDNKVRVGAVAPAQGLYLADVRY